MPSKPEKDYYFTELEALWTDIRWTVELSLVGNLRNFWLISITVHYIYLMRVYVEEDE